MKKLFVLLFAFLLTTFGFVAITVNAGGLEPEGVDAGTQQTAASINVTVQSYFDTDNHPSNSFASTYGTKMAVTGYLSSSTGYEFQFWIVNGEVRTELPLGYEFILTYDMSLIAVFHPLDNVDTTEVNELKYAVAFMDSNGDLLKLEYVAPGASATAPSTATITKIGYSINATTPWSVPYTAVADDVVTILQYDKIGNPSYTVTVVNGTGGGSTAYNAVTTVIAGTAPEGQTFHHWEMQDQTVSYASTFSFTVVKDTTVTAYYATSAPADQPRVFLTNDLALRSGYKTFIGQFYLPSGYTLVEWGIVTTAAATAMTDIGTASVIRNKSTKYTAATKEFVLSIVNANSASYRGYLICKDGSNALVTVYSETAYNILNGGFETGTLFGWNAYQIWKNESGMYAYANDRISSNPNYPSTDDSTSYPANNSGTYYLSSRFGSESSSRSQERMGHLRSSDFILGGSGWISFK